MSNHSDEITEVSRFFFALADGTRLRIIDELLAGPRCVCELAEVSGITQSGVSHQLRILRDLGVVDFERDGRHCWYSLSDAETSMLFERLRTQAVAHLESRAGRDSDE